MSATFVGMPAFPVAARAALADTQLRANLGHATSTIRAKRARVVAEVDDWEELRLAGAAIKDNTLLHLDEHLVRLEESLTARGRDRALGARRRGGGRGRRRDRQAARRRRGREGQVDGDRGDRPQRDPRRRRHRRVGDRPGRADRAARRRPAQPHPGAGDPPQPRRDPGDLPRAHGRGRPGRTRGPLRRAGPAGGGRPTAPAGEVPAGQGRRLRRELRGRGLRHSGGRGVRGQRPDVPDPARGAGVGGRDREGGADLGGPRRVPLGCCRGPRPGSG